MVAIFLLVSCIFCGFLSGLLFAAGLKHDSGYYIPSIAVIMLSLYLGICLVGEVASNPL